jgi:hypothetical protein
VITGTRRNLSQHGAGYGYQVWWNRVGRVSRTTHRYSIVTIDFVTNVKYTLVSLVTGAGVLKAKRRDHEAGYHSH